MTGPSRSSPTEDEPLPGFLARSPATRRLAELAARAAPRAASVLITGESGTGKSHLARAMHDVGRGQAAPFVIIDCANLPESLAESELFGHEAGAFSGATERRRGKFEVARGGTALLDRVSDLPREVQGKLLRVLQERSFERVGGNATVCFEGTVIATSTEQLPDLVRRGAFREDLFFRLNVVHLEVPPLRERREDVSLLAAEFLGRMAGRLGRRPRLTPRAVALLEAHSWPGNVTELQNVLERAVTLSESTRLDVVDLEGMLVPARRSPERAVADLVEGRLSLEEIERLYVVGVLRATGGRVGKAADILGIHRKTLLEKRKRWGLD